MSEAFYTQKRSVEDRAEIIVQSALARDYLHQRSLAVELPETVDLLGVFEQSRNTLRQLYAEPTGKLALHSSLRQQFVVVNEASGEGTWKYVSTKRAEKIAGRIEAALWPEHRVTDAVDFVVEQEKERSKASVSRQSVLATLSATWRRLGSLENEYKRSGSPLVFAGYVCEMWQPHMPPPKGIKPQTPKGTVWKHPRPSGSS